MWLKIIIYGFYMIGFRMKGLKYEYLKKFKGEKAAIDYVTRIASSWGKFTLDIIGIDLDVEGTENIPEESVVFIGNHSSILDIPIILYTVKRTVGFISKKEVLKAPIIGYWLRRAYCIPLDRENPREAIKVINEGIEKVRSGVSMVIFPEGTRSKNGEVGIFKKGSLKLATKAKAPIVPVSIDRASRAFEENRKFKPTKIKVVFGKPIYTKDLTKEEEKYIAEKVRDVVVSNLK